jgi:hypothetical protein
VGAFLKRENRECRDLEMLMGDRQWAMGKLNPKEEGRRRWEEVARNIAIGFSGAVVWSLKFLIARGCVGKVDILAFEWAMGHGRWAI